MMSLGGGLFGSILFGTLCTSWTWTSLPFSRSGKFPVITFSGRFLIPCSLLLLAPHDGNVAMPEVVPETSYTIVSFFKNSFSFCCSYWVFFASLYSKSLIWFSASSTLLLIPCTLFFISISVSFISDWFFIMVSKFYFFIVSMSSFMLLKSL